MGTRRQRGGCPRAHHLLFEIHTHPILPLGTKGHHVIEIVSELWGEAHVHMHMRTHREAVPETTLT